MRKLAPLAALAMENLEEAAFLSNLNARFNKSSRLSETTTNSSLQRRKKTKAKKHAKRMRRLNRK